MTTIPLPDYKMKSFNADFLVDEIYLEPRFSPLVEASYTYLKVQKEGLTTFHLLQIVADYFKIDVNDVEASGLKDEQAITRQIISIQLVLSEEHVNLANNFFNSEGLLITIRHIIGYGQQPVYARRLHGNNFSITIRNVVGDVADKVAQYLKANKFFTLINYYDEQRFGVPDSIHNAPLIGQQLLLNNWENAYQEYLKSGNEESEVKRVEAAFSQTQSYSEALQAIMPAKRSFFVSSYNSFLWNKALNKEIKTLPDIVQVEFPYLGLLAFPVSNQTAFPAKLSLAVEKKNWQTGDNVPTIKQRPVILNIPVYLLQQDDDKLHADGRQALTVAFYLPTGCYATMLVKQLLLAAQAMDG